MSETTVYKHQHHPQVWKLQKSHHGSIWSHGVLWKLYIYTIYGPTNHMGTRPTLTEKTFYLEKEKGKKEKRKKERKEERKKALIKVQNPRKVIKVQGYTCICICTWMFMICRVKLSWKFYHLLCDNLIHKKREETKRKTPFLVPSKLSELHENINVTVSSPIDGKVWMKTYTCMLVDNSWI